MVIFHTYVTNYQRVVGKWDRHGIHLDVIGYCTIGYSIIWWGLMGVYSNIILLLQAPKSKTKSSGFAKGRISHVEKLHIALSEPWYSISINDYFFICSLGIGKPLGQQNKKNAAQIAQILWFPWSLLLGNQTWQWNIHHSVDFPIKN